MTSEQSRICNSVGAAIVASVLAAVGCGSEAPGSGRDGAPGGLDGDHPPPPRPQTKEACDACAGLWAVHGIVPTESCVCRTKDAGERCMDGRDCEGQCLVEPGTKFQMTDETNPPRGFFTGTCSMYDTTFGCFRLIPSGVGDELPVVEAEAAREICVD